MSTLYERIASDIKDAMKQKDAKRLDTLRLLSAEIINFEKQNPAKNVLDDANILTILQKEHKKRMESYEFYKSKDLEGPAQKEFAEAEIIKSYLPIFLEESALNSFTKDFFDSKTEPVTVKDTGVFMKALSDHASSESAIFEKKLAAQIFNTFLKNQSNES